MRILILSLLLGCLCTSIQSQQVTSNSIPIATKKKIDKEAIDRWIKLGMHISVSNDGGYVSYSIDNSPYQRTSLIVQSTSTIWKKVYVSASEGFFTDDNKRFVFQSGDSLCIQYLGKDKISVIKGVRSYSTCNNGTKRWIAYTKLNSDSLYIYDLKGESLQILGNVESFTFPDEEEGVLLRKSSVTNRDTSTTLHCLNLLTKKQVAIWSGINNKVTLKGFSINSHTKKIALLLQHMNDLSGKPINSIWLSSLYVPNLQLLVSESVPGIEDFMITDVLPEFSLNGDYVSFSLRRVNQLTSYTQPVLLDVWNYKDPVLQSTQLTRVHKPEVQNAVISTDNKRVNVLTNSKQELEARSNSGRYCVLKYDTSYDQFWIGEFSANPIGWYEILDLKTNNRYKLPLKGNSNFTFSPNDKYLVYWDRFQGGYFSFNLISKQIKNLSGNIDQYVVDTALSSPLNNPMWVNQGDYIAFYDDYDIWYKQIESKEQPICITNHLGSKTKTKFRITVDDTRKNLQFRKGRSIILTAYNEKTKQNGFYKLMYNEDFTLSELVMADAVWDQTKTLPINAHEFDRGMVPIKANSVDYWVVKKQSAKEAPNYYGTTNFREFHRISNIIPNEDYLWLTAELHDFVQTDGKINQGVLYKPENFDSTKKYPVIFNYYQKLTHRLNQYPHPDLSHSANIDIATFVSKGYLVFTPDIVYSNNRIGHSAYVSVTSAASYLSKFSYIDTSKLAICGHSFGGQETNYIVTRTNKFCAALEGAGVSDQISSALAPSLGMSERGRLYRVEWMFGFSIWENPEAYLEESPILNIDKVSTPLLMMHCKTDEAVPWAQAFELFTAMRRLNKPVWLLQYDNVLSSGHSLFGVNAEDFSIRIGQFFDHYMKGYPAPVWMTRGITAKEKGFKTGFEFDGGACATQCKVCAKINGQ